MVGTLAYPDINGHRYSRTSVDLRVNNTFKVKGWSSLNWGKKLTPGKTWGNKAKPQNRTRGKFEPTAEIEIYFEDYQLLMVYLAGIGEPLGQGYMEVAALWTAVAFERVIGSTRVEIIGARIADDSVAVTNSDDQLMKKVTLDVMDIKENGLSAVIESDVATIAV